MIDLRLGDCLSILPTLSGIDAIVTDPPYPLVSGGRSYSIHPCRSFGQKSVVDAVGPGLLYQTPAFREWVPALSGCLASNAEALVFTNDRNLPDVWAAFRSCGWRWHNLIVWDKRIKVQNRHYMKQCEFILYLFRGKTRYLRRNGISNLLRFAPPPKKVHPSEKPVDLLAEMIATHDCDTILDPFMGSGSTGVACINTGRSFIGIESDPVHYATAQRRIAAELSRTALLPA